MAFRIPNLLEARARKLLLVVCAVFTPVMAGFAWLWFSDRIEWFAYIDIPLHLIGGLVSALCFLLFIAAMHGSEVLSQLPWWLRGLLVLGFTALVTIAWEFFENFTDACLGTQLQSTILETLKDMAVGLAGALPVATWLTAGASFETPDGES